ncbi:MAG: EamA/RhaT family transporter [Thermoprotei archaeon]|nr:MAG: EamA/RhaT family transporter [Thermoprotei archaeon]
MRLRIAVLLTVAMLSISSAAILVRLSGASATTCAFWRLALSTVILLALGLARGERPYIGIEPVIAGTALATHFILWMESLFLIPVGLSTAIVITYAMFTAIVDAVLFRERISPIQVLGLILSLSSITLMYALPTLTRESSNPLGITYSFMGALMATIYFSIGRATRRRGTALTGYTTTTYGIAALATLVYALVVGENLFSYPIKTWFFLILLALIPMLGGHTTMNYVLKFVKTSTVTSIALGEPVIASFLAYILLQEVIELRDIVLMLFTITGVGMVVLSERGAITTS